MTSKCNSCGEEVGWRKHTTQAGKTINVMVNPNGEDHKEKIGDSWVCKNKANNNLIVDSGQTSLNATISVSDAIEGAERVLAFLKQNRFG